MPKPLRWITHVTQKESIPLSIFYAGFYVLSIVVNQF